MIRAVATLMLTLIACPATPSRMQELERLDDAQTFEHERVIGAQYTPPDLLMRSMTIRDLHTLLDMGVAVSSPRGERVDAPDMIRRAQDELSRALGGWFEQDLSPYMTAHAGLWSAEERTTYRALHVPGADQPPVTTYRLALSRPPWSVLATGVPGQYHAIVVFQLLTEDRAVGAFGNPLPWPVGQVEPMLAEAVPRLGVSSMQDGQGSAEATGYPFYRSAGRTVVRARTGERLDAKYQRIADPKRFFFGVRINLVVSER